MHGLDTCIRIMSAKIIHNRFEDNIVGYKIRVPELGEDNVSYNSFGQMNLNVGLGIPVDRALTEGMEYDQTTTEMITMTIVIIEGTGNLMA